MNLTGKINLNFKDFHLGVAGEWKNKNLEKLFSQLVVVEDNKKYWARGLHKDEKFGVGCSIVKPKRSHSHELIYLKKKDAKGIKDFPVEIRSGGDY